VAKTARPTRAGGMDAASNRQAEQETDVAAPKPHGTPPGGKERDVLGDFAADLGGFLGSVQSRATTWLEQRKAITEQLTQIRDTASHYLRQLSGTPEKGPDHVSSPYRGKKRGRRPASAAAKRARATQGAASGRKRRTMSAAARKRISDAQKARWAKQRGE
jgi:hypothetical protein